MASVGFDIRLVPEFDGSGDVVDWIQKVEMVCQLSTPPTDQKVVIPLRLKGGASSVYRQLSEEDRKSPDKVKTALKRAFAADKFMAFEQFTTRHLQTGESVDVYLSDLQRLASLFGGLSDEGLGCAFVAGLPEAAKQVLRAGARIEALTLVELVDRARAVLREDMSEVAAAVGHRGRAGGRIQGPLVRRRRPCFVCGQLNHIARDCAMQGGGDQRPHGGIQQEKPAAPGARYSGSAPRHGGGESHIQCFRCRRWGHIAAQCQENLERGEAAAPASSRD